MTYFMCRHSLILKNSEKRINGWNWLSQNRAFPASTALPVKENRTYYTNTYVPRNRTL
jgi:hypothetical protein